MRNNSRFSFSGLHQVLSQRNIKLNLFVPRCLWENLSTETKQPFSSYTKNTKPLGFWTDIHPYHSLRILWIQDGISDAARAEMLRVLCVRMARNSVTLTGCLNAVRLRRQNGKTEIFKELKEFTRQHRVSFLILMLKRTWVIGGHFWCCWVWVVRVIKR